MLAIYKFIISLLAVGILYYYVVTLYGARHTKRQMFSFIVIIGTLVTVLMLMESYLGIGLRGLCVFIVLMLGTFFILKCNILQTVISCIVYSISLTVGDTFIVSVLLKIYGFTLAQIKSSLLLSFATDLIIYGTSIAILLIIMSFMGRKELTDNLSSKTQFRTSIYMLFTIAVIVINYSLHLQFINLINYKLALVNLLITWVYLILSLYINFTARELAIKEQEYNQQQDYIKTIDSLLSDYRRLKHNHANTIYSIYGYIQENDWDGLKEFYSEVMNETKRVNSNTLLSLQKVKVYAVFGLLWAKVAKAESIGVKMDIEVSDEINIIKMKKSDLCEVLGNYLDNALEGAAKSADQKVKISILDDDRFISIAISNSCDEELDLNKIYEKGYSSKGNGRGYGLTITEEILSRYKDVLHNTSFDEGIFKQELYIKK